MTLLPFALLLAGTAPPQAGISHPLVPMRPTFSNLPAPGEARAAAEPWWSALQDPKLDALIGQALSGNLDIAEAEARLDRARAGVRAADGARLPAAGASAEAAVAHLSEEDPQLGPARFSPGFERNQDRYALTLGASWEIDLFGRLGARTRAARADSAASAWNVEAARLAVTTEIAQRYVTLRLLQQRRDVAERRAAALARMETLSALRVERGVSPRIERDRLAADAQAAAAAVPALTAAIEDQFARLDVLAGRTVGTSRQDYDAPAPVPPGIVIDLAVAPADLLRRRPDILAAESALAARDARVAAALADRLPRFNLGGLLGLIAGAINPLFGAAAFAAQGSAAISYTAFDGGRSRANVEAARADVRGAAAAYQHTVLTAVAEVEASASAQSAAGERMRRFGEAERRLEMTMAAVQRAQAQGAASLSDVLDVERRLQDSRDARLIAQADLSLASISLIRALGGGFPAGRIAVANRSN
jgi:NodT family efflux transporter outer membrane factor (OMF) lipoprotein